MVTGRRGYPGRMSENTEHPDGSQGEPTDTTDTTDAAAQTGYDAGSDSDADPEMMNPRDLTGQRSGEDDPDLDPDSLNPRGDA